MNMRQAALALQLLQVVNGIFLVRSQHPSDSDEKNRFRQGDSTRSHASRWAESATQGPEQADGLSVSTDSKVAAIMVAAPQPVS